MPLRLVFEHGIIYCADFEREQVLYVLCGDPYALLQEPFLYASQYRTATQVACVPFDLLGYLAAERCDPVFVFSAGRCGSTLLAALLRGAGLPTASEPDLMTQLANGSLFKTHRGLADGLQRACISSLAGHCGTDLAVKFRSQCNSIAIEIAQAFPSAKFVFILREPIAWARSRYRAFRSDPKHLARIYWGAVTCYRRLGAANCRPILLWYDDIVGAPLQTLERLACEGLPLRQIRPEMVADVLSRDSQAGTQLSSRNVSGSEMTAQQISEFENECRRIMPRIECQDLWRGAEIPGIA
ncbi:MAG TPA: hypothetical protein VHT03_09200 [Rhizomicrobium sp.]|nr:hypothetical protein [Rhizomicrobium sp.]